MEVVKLECGHKSEDAVKPNRKRSASPSTIRIAGKTKSRLVELLAQANRGYGSRKVKVDDIIAYGISLVSDAHLEELRTSKLSNKDRIEMLYARISKERRGLTRDEFWGLLLEGKLTL